MDKDGRADHGPGIGVVVARLPGACILVAAQVPALRFKRHPAPHSAARNAETPTPPRRHFCFSQSDP